MKSLLLQLQLVSYLNPYDSEKIKDPVASYKLLRRVRTEWLSIVDYAQKSLYKTFQTVLTYAQIPQGEDWRGAASGLIRLQEIYKLYPHNITKDTALTADEAYYVGLVAYSEEKFQLAFLWFLYSLERVTEYSTITKQELLHYLCSSAYHFGSLPVAIYFCQLHLNLDPDNDDVKVLLNLYKYLRSQRTSFPDIFTLSTESNESWNIVVSRVNQRIADITGLSQDSPEDLFVQNYGIGGRYEPHYDEWMSDVEKGGATVFPTVGVALKPEKGSAVFWYNLHKNGNVDLQTQHAGCPVLRGNKWDQIAQLYEMKKDLLMSLSQCIDAKEEDVEMKSALQNLLLSYSESEDPEKAVRDPVAAYKLLRRLRSELIIIIEHFQLTYQCNTYEDEFLEIPELEDLDGAASGLIRLQEIYKLYPQNITNETSLNADEAYHVGVFLEEDNPVVSRVSQRIADITGLSKESAEDLQIQNYGIGGRYEPHYDAWDEENERIATFLIYMSDVEKGGATVFPQVGVALKPKKLSVDCFIDQIAQLFEKKNDLLVSLSQCIAAEENDEAMKSALQRDLLLYSDFVDPEEIMRDPVGAYKLLRQLSNDMIHIVEHIQPSLHCKKYHDELKINIPHWEDLDGAASGLIRLQEIYRLYPEDITSETSLNADEAYHVGVFLQDEDPVDARVSQRIADATGLSMETAESLHVQNYGIGGRYEPHNDALMSDVEIGGATVFPNVGVAVQPKKGSAVFWYNLHRNGQVDTDTKHAGCPVLRGNKWDKIAQLVVKKKDLLMSFRQYVDAEDNEEIQNYGIGGRYEPHYDAWKSDVEIGGATVFPQVGIALKPITGSAVFWYNLHKNGNVDWFTEHAGCPVLTDQIAQLVEKKKDLLMSFSQYIDAEEKNVQTMKSVYLNLLLSNSAPVDPEIIMRDPVAAYKLLRQLRNEFINILKHIQTSFYECNEYQDELEILEIPQKKDLDGAASGLIRLQEIYKLYPEDITNGEMSAVLH
ncbi:prolyl 4-hydroxylase subunit alpha-1-like protein [Labeo rohita]|uniref:procollagen-proline 4-dioxygenase n=1 Tax=Labeo rohita TaxID=84645 RepID=A0A498M3I8_LABRO|nr:prolyl 4-hydroxylase subunit alpha-1-like protein [Labeo rohita]